MRKTTEYKKRENEIVEKIGKICDAFDWLGNDGKDTNETLQRLEAALKEFELLRKENNYKREMVGL